MIEAKQTHVSDHIHPPKTGCWHCCSKTRSPEESRDPVLDTPATSQIRLSRHHQRESDRPLQQSVLFPPVSKCVSNHRRGCHGVLQVPGRFLPTRSEEHT